VYRNRCCAIHETICGSQKIHKPGCVSFSNRMFPTKAILAWRMFSGEDHCRLVSWYFEKAGGFREIQSEQLVSENSNFDPLYVVTAKKILV